jgi:hypothetical protein
LRKTPSLAMKRDCSHKVPPGGAETPPTITSPTSPSAWQETMWMILEVRMREFAIHSGGVEVGADLPRGKGAHVGEVQVARAAPIEEVHFLALDDRERRINVAKPSTGRA